jgi:hypothetical protein
MTGAALCSKGREPWVFRAAEPGDLLGTHVESMASALDPEEGLDYLLYTPIFDARRTPFGLRCEPASHAFAVTRRRFVLSTDTHREGEGPAVVSVPFARILAVEWGDSLLEGWVALHFAGGDAVTTVSWTYPATAGRKHVERALRAYRRAVAPAAASVPETPDRAALVATRPLLRREIEPMLLDRERILASAKSRELWSSPVRRGARACLSTEGVLVVSEAGLVYGEHAPSPRPNPLNFGLRGRAFPWQAFAGWTDQGEPSELVNESPAVARAFPGASRKARRRRRSGATSRSRNTARGDSGPAAVGRRKIHKLSGLRLLGLRLARSSATLEVSFAMSHAEALAVLGVDPPIGRGTDRG